MKKHILEKTEQKPRRQKLVARPRSYSESWSMELIEKKRRVLFSQ